MLEFTKAEELINLGYEAVKKEIPQYFKSDQQLGSNSINIFFY